jgi:D-lactate dehydrogenase (cytochrome)
MRLQPVRAGLVHHGFSSSSRIELARPVSQLRATCQPSQSSSIYSPPRRGYASSSSTSPNTSSRWNSGLVFLGGGLSAFGLTQLYLNSTTTEGKGKSSNPKQPDLKGYLVILRQAGFEEDQISVDDSDLDTHGHSPWSYHPSKKPQAVVYPTTVEQVQVIVKNAHDHGIVLLPFAGGTSLEAHWSAPADRPGVDRVAVSVDVNLMDRIGECNVEDGDIEVEAGVKYEDLNEHLKDQGIPLFFPIDPGPGAALGGMLGTGGSGTNAVRYGTMKGEYILAIKVVLPSGEVIVTKRRVRKSSVGPDLTKLFLGAEGTLGIVVSVVLRLAPVLPTSILVVPFPSIGKACSAAQQIVGSGVAVQCIELLDDEMIKVINKASEKTYGAKGFKRHIEETSLFIKLQGGELHRKEDEKAIRRIATSQGAKDKQIQASHDEEGNERLWRARKIALWSCQEAAPERLEGGGWKVWTTDVSVPLGSMATLFERVRKDTIETGLNAPIVGHIGDGGAHSIIVFKDDSDEELKKVKAFVHRVSQSDKREEKQ